MNLEQNKTNGNHFTVYIIGAWLLLITGLFTYFYLHTQGQNTLWSFAAPSQPTLTVLELDNKQIAGNILKFNETLRKFQIQEVLDLRRSSDIDSLELHLKNVLYVGSWDKLGWMEDLLPHSIVSFEKESQILRWKHDHGFYRLPLNADHAGMTYAIAAKTFTYGRQQASWFLYFDDANMQLFMEKITEKEMEQMLNSHLAAEAKEASFVALFKVPKTQSPELKIELLECHEIAAQ